MRIIIETSTQITAFRLEEFEDIGSITVGFTSYGRFAVEF